MPKQVNITVLGDGGVGKSSVTTRYVNNEFLESYDPTIQDSFRKSEIIDGEEITVEILDTAGQEDYVSINDTSIMQGQGFLIVFSLISRASFETVEDIIKKVYHLRECDVSDENKLPLVICGNKCDLESQRAVSKEEASSFASGKSLPYYECSAKNNTNISESFQDLLRRCIAMEALAPEPEKIKNNSDGNGCCIIL